MKNQATTVDDYLENVPTDRREALTRLRDLCRDVLGGYDESIAYGMPTYSRDGQPEIAFASQKNHIALYVMKPEVLERHRAEVPDCGKGCVRYRKPEQVDLEVVGRLLRDTATSSSP